MRNTLTLVWKLLVIALAAGLVLGLVNAITAGPIKEQEKIAADKSRSAAFPDAVKFESIEEKEEDTEVYGFNYACDKDGNKLGVVAASRAYGYKSDIEVVVGMDMSGRVVGIVIGENGDFQETAGLGSKVKEDCFVNQFKGLQYAGNEIKYTEGAGGFRIAAGSLKVEDLSKCNVGGQTFDAVSGATYSSNAVLLAFNRTVSELYKLVAGGAN